MCMVMNWFDLKARYDRLCATTIRDLAAGREIEERFLPAKAEIRCNISLAGRKDGVHYAKDAALVGKTCQQLIKLSLSVKSEQTNFTTL